MVCSSGHETVFPVKYHRSLLTLCQSKPHDVELLDQLPTGMPAVVSGSDQRILRER